MYVASVRSCMAAACVRLAYWIISCFFSLTQSHCLCGVLSVWLVQGLGRAWNRWILPFLQRDHWAESCGSRSDWLVSDWAASGWQWLCSHTSHSHFILYFTYADFISKRFFQLVHSRRQKHLTIRLAPLSWDRPQGQTWRASIACWCDSTLEWQKPKHLCLQQLFVIQVLMKRRGRKLQAYICTCQVTGCSWHHHVILQVSNSL